MQTRDALFFDLLECVPTVKKKIQIGDTFPAKPSYEEEIADEIRIYSPL